MANRGSLCTLTRFASFEEGEPTICLQAVSGAGGPPAAAPPPPPPEEQWGDLEAYLQRLGAAGTVELPPTFGNLVAAEEAEQRRACTASRGWLAPAIPPASADGQPALADSSSSSSVSIPAPSSAADPLLREALRKVQQLDGALQTAGQRAAAVAARGRELDQAMRDAGVPDENAGAGDHGGLAALGSAGCGLEGAMHRERRRLQQAELLRAALDGEPAEEEADAFQDGSSADALTPEQERLVEVLLGQADAAEEAAAAAPDAAQHGNPFCPEAAELAAIDARLAQLAAGSDGHERLGWAAAAAAEPAGCHDRPAVALSAAPPSAPSGSEDDLEALKASYLRARADALEAARRLTEIDAALASLRACDGSAAAH